MIKIFAYLVMFCFLNQVNNSIYACSMIYDPPVKFDSTEYIFIGKIIGYTGSLYSDSLHRSYQGLIVELVDPIYLPKTTFGSFEIIPYALGAACELTTWEEKSFRKLYPLGVELRIVGKETTCFESSTSSGKLRLDVSPYNMFYLSRNYKEPAVLFSSKNSFYDYRNACVYRNTYEDSNESFKNSLSRYDSVKANDFRISFQQQHHFELRKDLYRLAIAPSDSDKSEIIKRLIFFKSYTKKDFLEIINANIKNEEVTAQLISFIPKRFEYPAADTSLHPDVPASLSFPWIQANGPYGGYISCLALKESTDESINLFAGTGRNGVFLSTNNGENWTAANTGLTNPFIYTLFISGKNIYAGTDGGAFRSTNNGETWIAINSGFEIKKIFRVYAFEVTDDYIFAATSGSGVFRSFDNGENWIAVNSGISNIQVHCLLAYGRYLFAGTYGGIFISSNNGDNWKAINEGLTNHTYRNTNSLRLYINTILMSGEKLLIGTEEDGMYSSTNFGTTWDAVNLALKNIRVHSIIGNPSNLFVSTRKGIFHSTNNGEDWIAVNKKFSRFARTSIIAYDSILYTASYGVNYTTDYGEKWHSIKEGLNNTSVSDLTVSGENLIARLYTEGIFLSTDNGFRWSSISENLPANEFGKIASDLNNIFVGTTDGVYLSSNNGEDWTQILQNKNVRKLFLSNNYLFVFASRNLIRSSNCGESWDTSLTNVPIKSFGTNGNDLFVANQKEILRSIDNGLSWTRVYIAEDCHVSSFATSGDNLYAVAGECGVAMSSDKGENWVVFDNDFKYYGFSNFITYGKYLFATSEKLGVFISTNDGKDWIPFNFGLADLRVSSLVIKDNILFAGTTSGVWTHKL